MADCSSCGAAVVWAETPDHNRQPFNRRPDAAGNRVLLYRGASMPPLAVVPELMSIPADQVELVLFMPHHATCPTAHKHRKG